MLRKSADHGFLLALFRGGVKFFQMKPWKKTTCCHKSPNLGWLKHEEHSRSMSQFAPMTIHTNLKLCLTYINLRILLFMHILFVYYMILGRRCHHLKRFLLDDDKPLGNKNSETHKPTYKKWWPGHITFEFLTFLKLTLFSSSGTQGYHDLCKKNTW